MDNDHVSEMHVHYGGSVSYTKLGNGWGFGGLGWLGLQLAAAPYH